MTVCGSVQPNFRAFGTRSLIPTLTGGVFRPGFYKVVKNHLVKARSV
jgi:hypothetical protein